MANGVCPCDRGRTCNGIGVVTPPIGEQGTRYNATLHHEHAEAFLA